MYDRIQKPRFKFTSLLAIGAVGVGLYHTPKHGETEPPHSHTDAYEPIAIVGHLSVNVNSTTST